MATKAPTASSSQSIADLKTDTITLEDLGHSLPVGVFCKDGTVIRDYELHTITTDKVVALENFVDQIQTKPTILITKLFKSCVKEIGGIPLAEFCKNEELSVDAFIDNLFLADALAIILQARVSAHGQYVRLSGNCPACQTLNADTADNPSDLSTVEVKILRNARSAIYEASFDVGAKFGDEVINRINLRPIRVRELSKIQSTVKPGESKTLMDTKLAYATIIGTPQEGTRWASEGSYGGSLAPSAVKDFFGALPIRESASLRNMCNEFIALGPLMQSKTNCFNCGTEFGTAIPWQNLPVFLSGVIRV